MKPVKIDIRQYRPSLPFYQYSSRNKKGGKAHPRVTRMRNRVLDMWAEMHDYSTISEHLDISITTVVTYIKRARDLGDPRAMRPYKSKKLIKAALRRKRIKEMHALGMKPSEIAERLECTTRLVETRLKEMA